MNNLTYNDGYLGYFDILGFKKMIERNNLREISSIIDRVIYESINMAISIGGGDPEQTLIKKKIKYFIFSDTIILYETNEENLPLSKIKGEDDDKWQDIRLHSFYLIAAILMRSAFENGIPLRGAISYGEYCYNETNIFGQPLIEASDEEYKRYNWSGCVLCESAEEKYGDHTSEFINDDYFVLYKYDKVPTKRCTSKKKTVVRWDDVLTKSPWNISNFEELNGGREFHGEFSNGDDVLKYMVYEKKYYQKLYRKIESKFLDHNKENNDDVKLKIRNTVDFLIELYPSTNLNDYVIRMKNY